MATLFFQEEITKESVTDLIAQIESSEDQNIDIYFSSVGGDSTMANILIHYFTFCVKEIKLIFNWQIASAALDVMINSVCEKELLSDAWGVFHLYSRDIATRDMMDKKSLDKFLDKELAISNDALIKDFSSFFTRAEMKTIKGGGDIFIGHERFVKFFDEYAIQLEKTEEPEKQEEKEDEETR